MGGMSLEDFCFAVIGAMCEFRAQYEFNSANEAAKNENGENEKFPLVRSQKDWADLIVDLMLSMARGDKG
jgi:hypothetical protein